MREIKSVKIMQSDLEPYKGVFIVQVEALMKDKYEDWKWDGYYTMKEKNGDIYYIEIYRDNNPNDKPYKRTKIGFKNKNKGIDLDDFNSLWI